MTKIIISKNDFEVKIRNDILYFTSENTLNFDKKLKTNFEISNEVTEENLKELILKSKNKCKIFKEDSFNFFKKSIFNKENSNLIFIYDSKKNYLYKNDSFYITNNFSNKIIKNYPKNYLDFYFNEFNNFKSNSSILKILVETYLEKLLETLFHRNSHFYVNNSEKTQIVQIEDFFKLSEEEISKNLIFLREIENKLIKSSNCEENISFLNFFLPVEDEEISFLKLLKVLKLNIDKVLNYMKNYEKKNIEKYLDKTREYKSIFINLHNDILNIRNDFTNKITNFAIIISGSVITFLVFSIQNGISLLLTIFSLLIFFLLLYLFLKYYYFDEIKISKNNTFDLYETIKEDFELYLVSKERDFYNSKIKSYKREITNYLNRVEEIVLLILVIILIIFLIYSYYKFKLL